MQPRPDAPRTSLTHPIRVDWLDTPWRGRVGLTLAPGKKQAYPQSGAPWDRDLDADVARLRDVGTHDLVCLVEDIELEHLSIPDLVERAEAAGIRVHRLPIRDRDVPGDLETLRGLISDIVGWIAAGRSVVVHCMGGLGRAGTVGGCVLRATGRAPEDALSHLADRRPGAPETDAQRDFIRRFAPGRPAMRSRILGTVLGAATGDAMGHPTEFIRSMTEIRSRFGPLGVQGYELYWDRQGQRFAPYTDDTQMAEIVLRALVAHGADAGAPDTVMSAIATGFVDWASDPQGGHRAPGNACLAGARQLANGEPWQTAGGPRAGGCGSVMRAYPFGVIYWDDLAKAEAWAVAHSCMTHRDPIALAACAAMAVGVGATLAGREVEDVLSAMVSAAARHDDVTARMIRRAVGDAQAGTDPEEVLSRLEGWAAHEAIAAAAFVTARHPADPRAAILEGANTPGDSDSIATLAGALTGARAGLEAIPADWIRDLERNAELQALAELAADLLNGRAGSAHHAGA
ncbi:MAG: ADP-ribosylglycohydrolase family protein [Vicinamibacterales bacterium]